MDVFTHQAPTEQRLGPSPCPEGPEHSDHGVQYTEAGQTGPGPGRERPRARLPLSLPDRAGANGRPRGTGAGPGRGGAPPCLWGSCRADTCWEAHPREHLPVPACPLTTLLITAGLAQSRAVGWAPSRGCHPSSVRSERSLQLARQHCWGEGVPRAGPMGNAIPPSWLPGVGPGLGSPRSPGLWRSRPPGPLQMAWPRRLCPITFFQESHPGTAPPGPSGLARFSCLPGSPRWSLRTLDRRVVPPPRARCSLKAGTGWGLGSAGGACGLHEGAWPTRHVGLASCQHVQASWAALITPASLLDSLPARLSSGDRPGQARSQLVAFRCLVSP